MRFGPCAVAVAIIGCSSPRLEAPPAAPELHAPFDVARRRAAYGEPAAREPLPQLGPPVIDLDLDSYYADDAHSIIDRERKAAHDAAVAPLREFYRAATRLANRYVRTVPEDPVLAAAVLDALARWADAGALQGRTSQQGDYQRSW